MTTFSPFTRQHLADFERDGYVIIKGFFSPEEAALIYQTSTVDKVITD